MANFKTFKVTRLSADEWDYEIEIGDDAGAVARMTTSVDGLQLIAAALDEKLDEMVDAAERRAASEPAAA